MKFFKSKSVEPDKINLATLPPVKSEPHLLDEQAILTSVRGWNSNPPSQDELSRNIMGFTRLLRSYNAGQFDEYNADFKGTLGSANSEVMPGLYTVRARTRTLVKDTPQGKAVQRTMQNNVIGDKLFKLDMRVGEYQQKANKTTGAMETAFIEEEETNTAIEKFWEWYTKQENFTIRKSWSGMEAGRMVEASVFRDGSLICRLHRDFTDPNVETNEIGFAIDFLESDRLQETYQGFSGKDGRFGKENPIRGSVEYHPKWGFPLAYWILIRHPGDSLYGASDYPLGGNPNGQTNFREQVPANDIIFINNLRDRAEQDRGQTEMDAAVQPIWRNSQFTKALTLCAIASHIRAFVLEKKFPTGLTIPHEMQETLENAMLNFASNGAAGGIGGPNPVQGQQSSGTPVDSLRPGQERELPYGVEAKMLAPPFPGEHTHEFGLDCHREVAIATGVSYQHASGDYQNLGFIAGLMCQIPFQDWCKIRQKHHIGTWVAKVFREALRAAIKSGWFDRRGYDLKLSRLDEYCEAANFKGKRWAFVNPLVQAQTLILLMEAQIMSPQQVQDQLEDGISIEDLYTRIAEAKAEGEKHGIGLVGEDGADATRPAMQNGDPGKADPEPSAADSVQPPAKTKTSNPVRRQTRLVIPPASLLSMSVNGQH